jgi:hypothetical protein
MRSNVTRFIRSLDQSTAGVLRFSAQFWQGRDTSAWMQNIGAAQDRRCLPRLLCLSTVAQGRGCALGLLYFAAVQRSSHVGRDHLICSY